MDINLCSTPSCYFQPLHVDTSVVYTLDDEKFPGLNESQHCAEPTLMVAQGYGQSYMSECKLADDALWEEALVELFDLLETVDLNGEYPCQSENILDILPTLSQNAPEIGNGLPDLSHVQALGDEIIDSAQSASDMENGIPISRVPAVGDNTLELSQSHLEMGHILVPELLYTIYQMGYITPEISHRRSEMIPEISHSASEIGEITPELSNSASGMGCEYDVEYMNTSCLSNDASCTEDNAYCIKSSTFSLFSSRFSDMDGDINLPSVRDRCRWDCPCSQKYGSMETCSWKRTLLPDSETVEPVTFRKMGKCESKNGYCSQIQGTSNLCEYLHCDSKKTIAALQRSTKYHKKPFGITYSPYTTPSIRQW